MLSDNDKKMLDTLRDRLRIKVEVKTTGSGFSHKVEVSLIYRDDEGEAHEIDSDYADLPEGP